MSQERVPRNPSAVDAIAEAWVDTLVDLEPTTGTYIGRVEANSRYGDLSPAGHERYASEARLALTALKTATPQDAIDEVTQVDLGSSLELDLESHDARLYLRDLNVIASAAQDFREVYDLMPTDTIEDWATAATRLAALPQLWRATPRPSEKAFGRT